MSTHSGGLLESALGTTVLKLLFDPAVSDIVLNPSGELWVDRLDEGRSFTGCTLAADNARRVIYLIASSVDAVCNQDNPTVSAELPAYRARFQGLLPPVVAQPAFAIRKHAALVYSLKELREQGVLSATECRELEAAVKGRLNILVSGGTGSGKTTFANALLREVAECAERVVLIEDTLELQCNAADSVSLRSSDSMSLRSLVRATMRLRPDRIIIGEVRGPEALELLKAWNTGHPGGIATLHSDSAKKALLRLEQLIAEAGLQHSTNLIRETVDLVCHLERWGCERKVAELYRVKTR